jgi:hypothetical protein
MKIDYNAFDVYCNSFYIESLDKTFVDVQVQQRDGNKLTLHTDGWYGEYEGEDLEDLKVTAVSVTIRKHLKELR